MNEARAINRNIRSSPRKMRLVADLVRGKSANDALAILSYMPNKAARYVSDTLKSAVHNLIDYNEKHDHAYVDPDDMVIKAIFVDQGQVLKRLLPAPQGRAYRVRKRFCHVTIVVGKR